MMFSPTKAADMRWRASLLKQMKVDLTNGHIRTAMAAGRLAQILGEKIKTKDYTADDASYARLAELERRRAALRKGDSPTITPII